MQTQSYASFLGHKMCFGCRQSSGTLLLLLDGAAQLFGTRDSVFPAHRQPCYTSNQVMHWSTYMIGRVDPLAEPWYPMTQMGGAAYTSFGPNWPLRPNFPVTGKSFSPFRPNLSEGDWLTCSAVSLIIGSRIIASVTCIKKNSMDPNITVGWTARPWTVHGDLHVVWH